MSNFVVVPKVNVAMISLLGGEDAVLRKLTKAFKKHLSGLDKQELLNLSAAINFDLTNVGSLGDKLPWKILRLGFVSFSVSAFNELGGLEAMALSPETTAEYQKLVSQPMTLSMFFALKLQCELSALPDGR